MNLPRAGTLLLALPLAVIGCNSNTAPEPPRLAFAAQAIDLATARDTVVSLTNGGPVAAGPIQLVALEVRNSAGAMVPGPSLVVSPEEVATLNPGASVDIALSVVAPPATPDGDYQVRLEARTPSEGTLAAVGLNFSLSSGTGTAGASVSISGPTTIRQGDVVRYDAQVLDGAGIAVPNPLIDWRVAGFGLFDGDGNFVAYSTGSISVVAVSGSVADTLSVTVQPRGLTQRSLAPSGNGAVTDRHTSDLWVHNAAAYTGTWGARTANGQVNLGNTLYAWDISQAPSALVLSDSVLLDARTVNDVKVRADGLLGVATHEGSNDGLNGVTLFDLVDPLHPKVISRFTQSLAGGVHNAWLEGNHLYLVVDGANASAGLRVLDVSDPANPSVVTSFYAGSSFLHDVYLRNGLAFLSHWDAGLVILDVGHGMAGGSPANPVEVSRVMTQGGQTHNAWYWPAAGYVFVGEEDFATPGIVHVVDVSDLAAPVEVATMRLPGATPHNFWLDETSEILYIGWYENGIQAVDVSGKLMGELERQGRHIGSSTYGAPGARTWAPQLHNGSLFLADLNSGIWTVSP